MKYYYPDYFDEFQCVGGKDCPDSCCHIWQINVDKQTLKKYKKVKGELGKRMAEKIDAKTGKITPHGEENRCEFLNDDNLCDIVLGLGEDYLCNTCHTHPRHEEVYQDIRERSIAITCPIACKTLLLREEPVVIKEREDDVKDKPDRFFNKPVFEQLVYTRDNLLSMIQNRKLSISRRMLLCLGMAGDVERRIRIHTEKEKKGLFNKTVYHTFSLDEIEAVKHIMEEYKKSAAKEKMTEHVAKQAEEERLLIHTEEKDNMQIITDILFTLSTMEPLKNTWIPYLVSVLNIRNEMTKEEYDSLQEEFKSQVGDIEMEQLLFYFTYIYCCSSVYDNMLLAKIKMAVVNTLIIRELWFMKWLENDKNLTIDDKTEMAHWFVREVENSDENMEQWESLMQRNPRFSLKNILHILG